MQLEVRAAAGYRPADKEEVLLAAARYAVMDVPRQSASSPSKAVEALRQHLGHLDREVFGAVWLDARHGIIEFDVISVGTVDSAVVPVREVARKALERNAAACLLCHNHPSNQVTPSTADEIITQRIKDALSLFDIRVIDHVVLGRESSYSFAQHGLI
jgi:DNA repair protein RadC